MLAPLSRRHADHALVGWLDQNQARLLLPAVVIAELVAGVAKLRRLTRMRDAEAVEEWVASIMHLYAERILPLDTAAARETGLIQDRARAQGLAPGFADLAIAGIAQVRGLTLLTRNLRHFAPLGIAASDPFVALPE
jgi:predicted nucleic acid-binding protein